MIPARLRYAAPAVLILFAAGAAGLFASSRAAGDAKAPAVTPALTVTTAKPQRARLPLGLAANGSVAAWQEAVIGSESNGLRLQEVRVNVGDAVSRGDVLAVFDAAPVEADLAQARAAMQEAEANAAAAQADAKRARALTSSGALSEQQITQYVTAERTANARVASARATVAQQQLRLKYTKVVAPDSGLISARNATVGAVGGVGMELFRMIRQGRLEWRAEVTAADLPRIRPGQHATVKAASGASVKGTVRTVAPTVDAQTRIALVYVDLPPALSGNAPLMKAGMFASGQFALGESAALTVPQGAVALRDGFAYVFRLNADNRVSQVKVTTGRRIGERVEVIGLPEDAAIVTSGAGFLNDGDLVRNVPDAAPAQRPAKLAAR